MKTKESTIEYSAHIRASDFIKERKKAVQRSRIKALLDEIQENIREIRKNGAK